MSTLGASTRWLERMSDWANPILIKETRQALKSRQFVVTFMLLLSASWLLSLFGMLLGGANIEFGSVGTEFFLWYFDILALAVLVIIPFGCYRSLLTEREQTTYELLSITALSPRQVIWGKLLSAGLQLFIFYSAIAPFIAFTSLLQGFELLQVVFVLVAGILASLLACMGALMVSSLVKQGVWQAIVSLTVLSGLLTLFATTVMLTSEMEYWFDPSSTDFWWSIGALAAVGASYFLLFQQIATAQLTFESDNRSSGVRVVCAGQFVLFWGWALGSAFYSGGLTSPGDVNDLIVFCTLVSAIHWAVAGLFMVTERDRLSRRICKRLPRNIVLRLLLAPLLPGGGRGYLFLLLNVLLLLAVGGGVAYIWSEPFSDVVIGTACYLVAYLGIACALGRWCGALSHDIGSGHVRVLALILFAVACIAPYVPLLFGMSYDRSYHPLMITNPFATLVHLEANRVNSDFVVGVLVVAAMVGVMVNVLAILRGLREAAFAGVEGGTKL